MNTADSVQIRKRIKSEIDRIQDNYLKFLFRIVKTFQMDADETAVCPEDKEKQQWHNFQDVFLMPR